MRLIILALAAFIVSGPAAAQQDAYVGESRPLAEPWQYYPNVAEGFLVTFPGEPEFAVSEWELVPRRMADSNIYSVRYRDGLFTVTTVDAEDTFIPEEAIMEHAIAQITEGGEINHNHPTRVSRTYGRDVSVSWPDGTTTTSVLYYGLERLYVLEGRGPRSSGSDMLRFIRSLVFHGNMKNRTPAQLDAYWESCTRGANGGPLPLQPSGDDDPRCTTD